MKRWSRAAVLFATVALLVAWSFLLDERRSPEPLVTMDPPIYLRGKSPPAPEPRSSPLSPFSNLEKAGAPLPPPRISFGPVRTTELETARPLPSAMPLDDPLVAVTRPAAEVSIGLPRATGAPRGRISGSVLDGAGRPVAGARILFGASDLPLAALSRAGGSYESPPLPPGKIPVFVSHPELQPESRVVSVEPEGVAKLDLKLSPGERLVVRVRERSGNPIADAEIWIRLPGEPREPVAEPQPAREESPRARSRDDAPRVLFSPILPAEGAALFTLEPSGPEARGAAAEEWKFLGRTGDLGSLSTRREPGRSATVRARVAGYREVTGDVTGPDVEVVLDPAPAIRGHAVDAVLGLPVPLLSVRLELLAGAGYEEAPDRGRLYQSLAPGKFVVGLPPYPGTYRVVAFAEGALRGESPDVVFDGRTSPEPVIVPLEPRLDVAGVVGGPEGPVPGAVVEILLHDGLGPRFQKLFGVLVPAPLKAIREAHAGAQGAFVFRDAVPGACRLRARKAGLAELITPPLALPWDGEYPILLRKGSTLSGTLFDPESMPEAGVPIILISGEEAAHVSWTDPSGRFEFRDLAPGDRYRIAIGDPSGETSEAVHSEILLEEAKGRPGAAGQDRSQGGGLEMPGKSLSIDEGASVVFDLRRDPSPLGSLDGIVESDGRPVPGIYVRARRIGEDPPPGGAEAVPHEAMTDARGEFRLRSLPPGDYVISSGPYTAPENARVEAGRRARAELRSKTARLRIDVTDRVTGEAFEGSFQVEVERARASGDEAPVGESIRASGAGGKVEIPGLLPGKHVVRLRVRGVLHEEKVVDLSGDAEERLSVEETEDVTVRLLVAPSEPFRGRATITVFKEGREIYRGTEDVQDAVTVRTAGKGDYEIHVRSEDRSAKFAFELKEAP